MYPARPEIVTVVCSAAVLSGRASIDGHELWRVNRDEIDTWSTPLVGDGIVFVMRRELAADATAHRVVFQGPNQPVFHAPSSRRTTISSPM